jgi:hypothetical protein
MDEEGVGIVLVKDLPKLQEGEVAEASTFAVGNGSGSEKAAPYLISVTGLTYGDSPSASSKSTLSAVIDSTNEKVTIFVKSADTAYRAADSRQPQPKTEIETAALAPPPARPSLPTSPTAFFPGGNASRVTVVPNCTTMRAGLLIAQLPQLGMWTKRDSKMKVISKFSVVFMQV